MDIWLLKFWIADYTHNLFQNRRILVIGIIAVFGHWLAPSGDLATIIAAVMPIVPGVLITNAIQDLFGGHMMMFTTKSLEALVTAFGIGAGVGSILILV